MFEQVEFNYQTVFKTNNVLSKFFRSMCEAIVESVKACKY